MLKSSKLDTAIVNIFIILLAVSPAFALGDGNKNLLLIGAMCLSPFFLIRYPILIPKIDLPLTILCVMMISFTQVFHPETMRWPTILYSCLYCIFFMAFARVLHFSNYTAENFVNIIKWLLYAYCIVLIIQQICVLTGVPVFNLSNYNPAEPWKLNSLMSEPSHSARIVSVLMYLFISYQKKINPNLTLKASFVKNKTVWLSFLWPIFTMVSTTAFIFSVIVLAKFITIRKILPTMVLLSIIAIFTLNTDNKTIKRATKVIAATLTFDENAIIQADHSASFRIVPTLQGAKAIDLFSKEGWIGNGVDADSRYIKPLPTVKYGNAGAFYMWFNYGFLCAIVYWIFSLRICFIKDDWVSLLIWFMCIFIYGGINNQIIWLTLALMYTYKLTIKQLSYANRNVSSMDTIAY